MNRLPIVFASASLLVLLQGSGAAQWLRADKGIPRTNDGKINLSAPAPRTADGKPDIQGVWQLPEPPLFLVNLARDLQPDQVVMTPWAQGIYQHRRDTEAKDDPHHFCIVSGVPRSWTPPYPAKIIVTPQETIILFEAIQTWRQIFTDNRELPKNPNPTWMGYSIGRWEGDSFVIETSGFKDEGWLDTNGHPSSDQLHVTERLRRRDFGHLDVEVTIDDPKAYKKPWTTTLPLRYEDSELLEFICAENNRDLPHLVGK